MSKAKIIVIGGGPAGLMAAIAAAQQGAGVTLLEKMPRPAQKLLLTGNGRCNLTNTSELSDFLTHFRPDGRFLRQAFSQFFSRELMTFFEELNVGLTIEPPDKVFVSSGKARDAADALLKKAKDCGAEILTGCNVKRLFVEGGGLTVIAQCGEVERQFKADAVIIAAGGASYPQTGSTGEGFKLAESLGHRIVPIRPALVPIKTAGETAQKLQGVSVANVVVTVFTDNRKQSGAAGEMLFTHYGLSGPVILSLSGDIVDALREGKSVSVSADFVPALAQDKLDRKFAQDFHSHGKQQAANVLKNLLPKRLAEACLTMAAVPAEKICSQITSQERKKLTSLIKDFRLEVSGHLPLADAIVTAGGVDTKEIDPRTMQSKLVPGLYFAGEVINIDGLTGGYNLQAAFSTGRLAGLSAAASVGLSEPR